MGIFDKLKGNNDLPSEKVDEVVGLNYVSGNNFDTNPVMMNDGINICAEACASCWDTKLPDGYEDKASYIGRRAKTGHTSILEHSNLVFIIPVDMESESTDLIEFLSQVRYLKTLFKISTFNKYQGYLLIGGTWRGYSDLFYIQRNFANSIFKAVWKRVYEFIPAPAMTDLIETGVLLEEKFAPVSRIDTLNYTATPSRVIIDDTLEVLNCDDPFKMCQNVADRIGEPLFTVENMLDFCSVTVLYRKMSRIITQQLTRHRNGITQESQRYVNYSKNSFNSPALFKDKYDPKHKYDIHIGSTKMKLTLQEIGDLEASIYGQLDRKNNPQLGQFGLDNEDARAFLPNNIQCGKVYMTFTLRSFIKYLQLREDSHAQAEMKMYALKLGKWFRELFAEEFGDNDIYDVLQPNVKLYETGSMFTTVRLSSGAETIMDPSTEILETLEEHVQNYDESQDEPDVVVEEEVSTLRHGEE